MNTTLVLLAALAAALAPPPEVRQIVTFELAPGKTDEAIALFRDDAVPIYEAHAAMRRFRAYREAESPEPLDLVVVSTFQGMAGMDAFHESVRASGVALGELYGRIGAITTRHHDEFVEMDPALGWGKSDGAPLVVLVSIQIEPGGANEFETLLREDVVPWEKELDVVRGSETGRFLLSGGWHYFRFVGLDTLGDWHRYVSERRRKAWWRRYSVAVTRSKEAIVVPLPELSVR